VNDQHPNAGACPTGKDTEISPQHLEGDHSAKQKRKSLSLHEDITVWCDCCSCEAEPYWIEAAEAMGIDPGCDLEDADPQLEVKVRIRRPSVHCPGAAESNITFLGHGTPKG
jgi:hypothetical protein